MKARLLIFALAVTGLLVSCNEYYEDMESIGKRVKVLEDSVLTIDNNLSSLEFLIQTIENNGVIKDIKENNDGSYTIYVKKGDSEELIEWNLKDGLNGADGLDGLDGQECDALLGVAVDDNGRAYWIFNGEPLLDEDGNVIPVRGPDGKDGADGKDGVDGKDGLDGKDGVNGKDGRDGEDGRDGVDGKDASPTSGDVVLPLVRISDGDNPTWLISTDGGQSWTDTNWPANGKDGKDGKDGKNGTDGSEDPIVKGIDVRTNEVIFYVYVPQSGNIIQIAVPRE